MIQILEIDMSNTVILREQLRQAALSSGPERDTYLVNHPLNMRPVEILTRSIEEAYLQVVTAVKFRQLGLCFQAPFRLGKTTAACIIAANISQVVERLAVHLAVAKTHEKVSERAFYGDLCDSFMLSNQGTAEERSGRLRKAIVAACQAEGGNQFLLMIDEGQNWGEKEWQWLRDTGNVLLKDSKITLSTVTFGDMQLGAIRGKFQRTRQDLWARFMMKSTVFSGIRGREDLAYFLSQLDDAEKYEYPSGSNISYSEFFLPLAYNTGWRLESQTDAIWQAFERAASTVNRKVEELGMQWVSDTVVDFLISRTLNDFEGFNCEPDGWDSSVAASRYVESLV